MSEKHLTELPWKMLVTKQKLKDPGLGKALAAYGKCGEKDYGGKLEALDDIEKHGASLKKEHAKEKEITEYVAEVLKESDKSRKALTVLAKKAKDSEDEGKEGEDEEAEEYKKDLKAKLVSALAQVKSRAPGAPEPGEEEKPQLQFMAYVAGKASAVIVARKVGGSKKLLPSIAGGASGGAYYHGECIFEKSAHTFVLDQVPGGLAKKLSKALLTETGQKYKVRVRSADGSVELDGDTDTDPDDAPGTGTVDLAAQWKQLKLAVYPDLKKALEGTPPKRDEILKLAGEAQRQEKAANFQGAIDAFTQLRQLLGGSSPHPSPTSGSGEPAPDPKPSPDLAASWKQVKIALYPKIKESLERNPPNRDQILKLVGEATRHEKAANFQGAIDAFNELRPLLGGSGAGTSESSEHESEEKEAPAPAAANLAVWTQAKDQVSAEINKLCDFLLKLEWEDETEKEDRDAVTEAARRLAAATELTLVNVKWTSALMNFDNAGPAQRRQLFPALSQILAEYKTSLSADPALTAAEDHPMVPVNAKKPLLAALDGIQKNLETLAGA